MIILLGFFQWVFGMIFWLPPGAALYLMRLAGELTFQIARLMPVRKAAAHNIRGLFPNADGEKLADNLLKNVSYSIFEVLCTPFFRDSHLKRFCKINGQENIDLSLAKRKGILLLLMHTGNYELTPAVLTSQGYRVNSILKAPDDPIFKLINRSRSYKGARLINILEADMYRESIKALGQNEIVCLLIDTGALEGRHEMFPFLGRKVPVATGWLTLAERSEAAVIPAYSKREADKVVLNIGEPLRVYRDNREEVMRKVGRFYENFIKNHPDQWAIFLNSHEVNKMLEGK